MSNSISTSDLDRLDIDEVKRFLVRRWPIVLSAAVGCVVIAAMVCILVTPTYTATSQVLLDPRKQHIFGTEAVNPDSALDSSIVDSQIPIILSNRILAKVIAKEHLTEDPEFAAPTRPGMLDRFFGLFQSTHSSNVELPSVDGIDPKLAPVILRLFNKVDVTRVAKSFVLSIAAQSRDPAKAMRLANTIAQVYVEDQVDVHAKSTQQAASFFEQRLGRLREQVRESERAVAEFRKAHDLATTSMDGKITVGEQQLQSLNEELAKISADSAEKLAKYQQGVKFSASGSNLDSLPDVIRSPLMAQLRTQQADLIRRESDLSAMYGPAYPAITQIRAQKTGLSRAITIEIKRLVAVLKNDYEVATARETSLRKTIAGLSDVSGGDNDVGVKLRELERANLANKALFENFLNRAKLTQEQSSFEEPDARLISPALEPTSPSSPKVKLILPVAGVIGLLLGLGLAALLDLRRKRVVIAPSAQSDAFVLARVPLVNRIDRKVDLAAYQERYPDSDLAVSIRSLAERLMARPGKVGRVLTLAPSRSGEGATSLALCLAEAVGKSGKTVLLIDADLHQRGLSRRTETIGRPGLAETVSGLLPASRAVDRRAHFTLLPAGVAALDFDAGIKALRAFLKEARTHFDLVLVDASALDAGGAATTLGRVSDGLVLVASWDELMRDSFVVAIDTISENPAFAGVILNRTAAASDEAFALAS